MALAAGTLNFLRLRLERPIVVIQLTIAAQVWWSGNTCGARDRDTGEIGSKR